MITLEAKIQNLSDRLNVLEKQVNETASATGAGTMTQKEFLDLFTQSEWIAWNDLIDDARLTPVADRTDDQRAQIASYRYFETARGLLLDDPKTIAGVQYLRAWGVLGSDDRVNEILSNTPPPSGA